MTKPLPKPPPDTGRCVLCGMQAVKGSDYCKGHQWAALYPQVLYGFGRLAERLGWLVAAHDSASQKPARFATIGVGYQPSLKGES